MGRARSRVPLFLRAQADVRPLGVRFRRLPRGFGTLDELFEALTLIQTGKIRHFPVVLAGAEHWQGLLEWLRERLLETGKVGPADVELLRASDDVNEICALVEEGYRRQLRE